MQIKQVSGHQIITPDIVSFLSQARQKYLQPRKMNTNELTKQLREVVDEYKDKEITLFKAVNSQDIFGLLLVYLESNEKAIIYTEGIFGRPPLVSADQHLEMHREIAAKLFDTAKSWVIEKKLRSLDFNYETEGTIDNHSEEIAYYQSFGFQNIVRGHGMRCDLTSFNITGLDNKLREISDNFQNEFEYKQLSEVHREELYHCYYNALKNSDSQYFLNQSETEKKVKFGTIEEWGGYSEPTSMAVYLDNKLVGFTIIYPINQKTKFLDWMVILPELRNNRLGTYLLLRTIRRLIELGCEYLHLFCEIDNTIAFNLYTKYGFSPLDLDLTYRWKSR